MISEAKLKWLPGLATNQQIRLYTLESLREPRRLLAKDGWLILSFGPERWWIADRLFVMATEVFGHEPVAYSLREISRHCGGGENFTLLCSTEPRLLETVKDPQLRELIQSHRSTLPAVTRPTTDDWPYLYLEKAKIPKLHPVISLTILGPVALAGRKMFETNRGLDWHFFALGAAFLLLEVQAVSRATLLFGMTWIVNAIVISAVLVMILAANVVAARWPRLPHGFIVCGLAVTVVALAVMPLAWFNTLNGPTKLIVAAAFLTAPVFSAGLVFIRSFARCNDRARALRSNLIGALVGGLLESLSFVTGIRALVILVGAFYVWAVRSRPSQQPPRGD